MDFHRQGSLVRSAEWGPVSTTCRCGWDVTRPTAYQAMLAYDYHSHNRAEPVEQRPHVAVSDMARQGRPLGAAFAAVRTTPI